MASSTQTPPAPAPQQRPEPTGPEPDTGAFGDCSPAPDAQREAEAELALDGSLFAPVVRIPFARTRQPLEDYEAEALGDAVAAVFSKYMPSGAGRYQEEMQLGLVLLMILQPRLGQYGKAKDSESGAAEAESNRAAGRAERVREDLEGTIVGGIRPAGTDH